jgi:hypothetical protein
MDAVGGGAMTRVLSIFIAITVVVVLVAVIGMVVRTPRFAEIRGVVEGKVREAMAEADDAVEPSPMEEPVPAVEA